MRQTTADRPHVDPDLEHYGPLTADEHERAAAAHDYQVDRRYVDYPASGGCDPWAETLRDRARRHRAAAADLRAAANR